MPCSKSLKKFLRRTKTQWAGIFEKIEGLRGKPVTAAHELEWAAQIDLGDMTQWKEQLQDALESYTIGLARKLVDSCGETKSFDCWRQMTDRGDSLRPAHANALRTKAFGPPKAVPAKELEATIALWDADVARYERATGEVLPPVHYRMGLEDVCPERLRNRLRDWAER